MEVIDIESVLDRMFPGARILQPYFKASPIQTINAGSVGLPTTLDLIKEQLQGGAGLILTDIFPNLIDNVGHDFVFFGPYLNGAPMPGADTPIFGVQGTELRPVPLVAIWTPGTVASIKAINNSGTEAVPNLYPAATNVRVAASIKGWLWRPGYDRS